MSRVLLVEDDGFKSDEIQALLAGFRKRPETSLATSVSEAVRAIKQEFFELIILDMALPSHTAVAGAGAPLSLLTGGLEVLFELQSLRRMDPCIVITQYPEIEICGIFYPVAEAPSAIEQHYGIHVFGCIEYTESSEHWRERLTTLYGELCAS